MLRARANGETFVSVTKCPQQCFLVCQGLNKVLHFVLSALLRPWQTRTHCCGHTVADKNVSPFVLARNICCGHKLCVRDTKNISDFVQKHFLSATNVSQFAQHGTQHSFCVPRVCAPKKHHEQPANNVSATICPRLPGPLRIFEWQGHPGCLSGQKWRICARHRLALYFSTKYTGKRRKT